MAVKAVSFTGRFTSAQADGDSTSASETAPPPGAAADTSAARSEGAVFERWRSRVNENALDLERGRFPETEKLFDGSSCQR